MLLDPTIKTQINTYLDALDDALDRMLLHTNILSGQETPDRVYNALAPLLPDLVDLQPYVDAALAAAAASLSSANDANAFMYSAQAASNSATEAAANASMFAGVAAASALDANSSAYAASVFAQFANTSANSSGNYAAAAQASAIVANSSANNANTYATAAFTSAVAANTFANTSASWAAAAQASALSANASANNANTYAVASAANAVSANNSAAAASANATLSASYASQSANTYKATILIGGDPYFAQGLDGYSTSTWGAAAANVSGPWSTHTTGFSWPDSVLWPGGNGNNTLFSKKLFDVDTSKRYRFSAEFGTYRTGSSGETNTFYFGFVGLDATGAAVSHGAYGTYRYATTNGSTTLTDGQTIQLSAIVTGEGNDSWVKFPPGTKQVALMCIVNYTGGAQNSYVHYMTIEQIESEMLANTYAGIATTAAAAANASAAAANTSQTLSATYASQAAANASSAATSASQAASNASSASASAVSANNSAAAASTSATVSAQIGAQMLNRNSNFADWPGASGTIPNLWADWTSGTTNTKQPGLVSQNAFEQTNLIGTVNQGIYSSLSTDSGMANAVPGWYVITGDVTLISGSLRGAGVYAVNTDSGGSGIVGLTIDFFTDPDASGSTVGAGTAGKRYKFTKLIQYTSTSTAGLLLYAMTAWTSMGGGTNAAKVLRWHQCGIRPATVQEIQAKTASDTATSAYANASFAISAAASANVAAYNANTNATNANTAAYTALARAAVTLDVSGYVTGWEITNGGTSGQMTIRADKFTIVSPGGGARTEYSSGNWRVYDANNTLRVRLGIW